MNWKKALAPVFFIAAIFVAGLAAKGFIPQDVASYIGVILTGLAAGSPSPVGEKK